ncbi:MAG: EamA/RhaT family transporter [Bacteroidota bacterium]|nr:EamA/RhaT family transporter [Bacteroidota bacterium]
MIYLLASILLSTSIFVTFKLFDRFGISNNQAITTNYLVGAILGFSVHIGSYDFSRLLFEPWFFMAVIEGFLFIAVFHLFAQSSQKAGVAVTAVASKMSVIIPVVLGIILYKESASVLKILGIITALLAFYLTFKRNRMSVTYKRFALLPLLLFLGNGAVDSVLKYAEHHYIGEQTGLFLSTVFLVALLTGIIMSIFNVTQGRTQLKLKNIAGGSLLGIFNYSTTYFILLAMAYMESSVLYPIFNAGIISLSAIVGFLVFSEKIRTVNLVGIILSIIAIFVISFA